MAESVSWTWLGEPLAIDLANTVKRDGARFQELWRTGEDVVAWAARQRGRVPPVPAPAAAARLGELRAVRDDVLAVLRAAAAGGPWPRGAAGRLDARAREQPVVAQLTAEGPVAARSLDPIDELLARAVHDAIDLARDPSRLGFCDAPSCGQLFVRGRADQRWCGPACGTRARVAAHARRHKRAG